MLAREQGIEAHVREASRHLHNLAVQGPRSREALASVVWSVEQQPRLDELKRFQFLVGRLNSREGPPILVSRSGYTGELGYEVFCMPGDAPAVWDAILAAGEPLGMKPMGLDALDIMRIEAGLPAAGAEFDETIDPFEAGVGFAVPLAKKAEDFVGRSALERCQAAPRRSLVGLVFETAEPVAHGDPVFAAEQVQAGVITSACVSPRTGTALAMARLAVDYAEAGRVLEVGRLSGDLKRLRATATALPLYRP
jgi:aminomethyltransferase